MPRIRTEFGGLNTDTYPTRLRSGEADIALNVDLSEGNLQKRAGFGEWEDNVDGKATAIKAVYQVEFANGDVYIVCKLADGTLWRRQTYSTAVSTFTQITTEATHNGADRGWWGMRYDRLHYFDRGGGTRWHPDHLSVNSKAFKAGITRATTGALPAQAAEGEKDGYYRVVLTYRNSLTGEEGMFSGPQAEAIECRRESGDTRSGLSIINWATINALAAALKHEVDEVHFYCTNGNTEYHTEGAGYEVFSHIYYDDSINQLTDTTVGLNKADEIHQQRDRLWNDGGEPPGSRIGCFTATRGIYGLVYASGSLVESKIMYSKADYPTMVPQRHEYTQGGDSKTVEPPYVGEIWGAGPATAIAFGGGVAALFTPTTANVLSVRGDGRMQLTQVHSGKGCVGDGAAAGTPGGVHALGYRSWLILASGGIRDIAEKRFATTLADIPLARQAASVMAYYSFKGQVWCAVTKAGSTAVQRILIWDPAAGPRGEDGRPIGALWMYDPACLAADESITAMCELNSPAAEPTMLVATSKGRLLNFPSGDDDGGINFVADWRGYFATERLVYDQALLRMLVHCGTNVAAKVNVSWDAMRTPAEALTAETKTLTKSSAVEAVVGELTHTAGNLFRVRFTSVDGDSTQWTVHDLVMNLDRTDKKR